MLLPSHRKTTPTEDAELSKMTAEVVGGLRRAAAAFDADSISHFGPASRASKHAHGLLIPELESATRDGLGLFSKISALVEDSIALQVDITAMRQQSDTDRSLSRLASETHRVAGEQSTAALVEAASVLRDVV
jgi:hypothetical protein